MSIGLDIIGAISSIVQLVEFTAKVYHRLDEFQSHTREIPNSFRQFHEELPLIQDALERIKEAIDDGRIPERTQKALVPTINGCQTRADSLQTILRKALPEPDASWGDKVWKALVSLMKDSKAQKHMAAIKEYLSSLTFYFMASLSSVEPQADEKLIQLRQWLSAPDPLSNYRKAARQHHMGSGRWFLESEQFARWRNEPASSLWLYGIPGCGKTILISTILGAIHNYCQEDIGQAVAYFFFDFTDPRKQEAELMIHSLVSQLSLRCMKIPVALNKLFISCRKEGRRLSLDEMLHLLHIIILEIPQTYIVIDALDECGDRKHLMDILKTIDSWKIKKLHVLVTSRRERDIEASLLSFIHNSNMLGLRSEFVDVDIEAYIRHRLTNDDTLQKWAKENTQEEIEAVLVKGAKGMFQWAACQLDSLKRCRNRKTLYKALVTLPSTLDETYDRILCSIHKDDVDYAIRILHWLAFSKRPLTVQELSEVIAIELDRRPAFDRDEVLEDKMEVLDICSSLVAIRDDLGERNIVVLAHYSVKEYLTSDRCALGPAARFKINMDFSNEFIARSCLAYLLQFQDPALLPELRQSALAQYAAQYWIAHAQAGRGQSDAMQKSIMELFSCNEVAYVNWVRIFDPDKPPNHRYPQLRLPRSYPPQPQYYAARFGLVGILKLLLNNGADVNVHGGRYGTAIHAASTLGYGEIVEVLLKYRANVKKRAKGTRCETALTAASRHGHLQIVELLLNNGADVNTQGESFSYGTALQAASRGGHVQIVDLLLNKGADVNITGGRFGNALIAASFCGYLEIAVRLIDAGANIDAADMSNDYGTALHAASRGGHLPIVELLLRRGADVNIHHGDWGTALIAASEMGQYHIVQILVNHGVNVNLQSKRMGTALQVTAERGQIQIARLLLSKGAEVNGEVLCSASRGGHLQLVELLLNNHPKIDAYGQNGTALVVASRNGHLDVVELLLSRGADINAQISYTALQGATAFGHTNVARLLIKRGADVNVSSEEYGSALEAAVAGGTDKHSSAVIRLLLDHGAIPAVQTIKIGRTPWITAHESRAAFFGSALQAASVHGNRKMVEFLLNSGVDVNAHCGHWGTALIGASCKGHVAIVRLLLKYGADIHQQDARYGNAVQAACCTDRVLLVDLWVLTDGIKPNADDEGFMNGWTVLHKYHPKVIKLLLENGADINARGGKHGSAIQAAWDRGHDKTVDFLIRRGANESGLIRRPRYKFCGPPECLEPSESSDSMSDTQSEL